MEIGYVFAFFIGLFLSLLGGGGSVLTVPVLVYIFMIEPSIATSYSLLIVGISSFFASLSYIKNNQASLKTAFFFSFPSFAMVFVMRKYILPMIPSVVFSTDLFTLYKNTLIMAVFAILMLISSVSMIRSKKKLTENIVAIQRRVRYHIIFIEGIIVGCLTGFVGVGGGFLIIPILTLFVNLPMKMAVGTSLIIITINSIFGFLGEIGRHSIDWQFLAIFMTSCIFGVCAGIFISTKIESQKLKVYFGWFTLLLGIVILLKEFLVK